MSVKEILQIGHPILAACAQEVDISAITSQEIQDCIEDMIDTMRVANGAGISANQIGIPNRIFVMEISDNPRYPYKPTMPLTVVINPEITFLSDAKFTSNEGCLSVPNMRANVKRHLEIAVSYYDENGVHQTQEVRGYSACTWQHEYDHLDGILFPHRVTDSQSFCSWESFKEYQEADYATHVRELVAEWGA